MEATGHFTIVPALTSRDFDDVRHLFTEYTNWLDMDLTFQDFQAELDNLPGKYGPPSGRLLLARASTDGKAIGCVGVRQLSSADEKTAELKRLYVLPETRGLGVGLALARTAIGAALEAGYGSIKLDTLPIMKGAKAMYRRLGFKECERYYDTPVEGTAFLRLDLDSSVVGKDKWRF